MCRPVSTYRSAKTVSSPNAAAASRRARGQRLGQIAGVADDPHAPAAAAGGGLDQHREVGRPGRPRSRTGSIGTPALASSALASTLEPIAAMASAGGPTQVSPASMTAPANSAFSDEEAVAGVHGVRAGPAGRLDDQVAAQVRLGGRAGPRQPYGEVGLGHVRRVGVGVGVDRDRRDPHAPGRWRRPGGRSRPGWPPAGVGSWLTSGRRRSRGGGMLGVLRVDAATGTGRESVRVSRGSITPSS